MGQIIHRAGQVNREVALGGPPPYIRVEMSRP